LDYHPSPTLSSFMLSNAFVRGVVGPIGSGKSSACAMELLVRAAQQRPGPDGVRRARFAIIRNTYRELHDTTRRTLEQWWLTSDYGKWNEQDFTWTHKSATLEVELLFRALDRPDDVKKLLSLELTGAYLNELREIAKEIFDGVQGRVGRYPSKAQGGPSWFGVWFDSNPWHKGHWADELFKQKCPEDFELYEQPDGLSPEAENTENLPAGYYERLCQGKDADWVDCYVRGKYPSSDRGSIYGALLADLSARGGVAAFEDVTPKVFTMWDLGGAGAKGDATGFWVFGYDEDGNTDLLDYLEGTGKPLSFYFEAWRKLAKSRGYRLERTFLPHDARAKSLQTGMSVEEMFRQEYGGGRVTVLPLMSLADGLSAGRWLLEQSTRIHPRVSELHHDTDADALKCLREYRRKWDEKKKVFSSEPVHDWASHCADAFRGVALVCREAYNRSRPTTGNGRPDIRPAHLSFTLDELWASNEVKSTRRGALYR
jgi:hypothetical protein